MSGSHRVSVRGCKGLCVLFRQTLDPVGSSPLPSPPPPPRTGQGLTVDKSFADGTTGTGTAGSILGTLRNGATVDTLCTLTEPGFRTHELNCTKDGEVNQGLAVASSQKKAWRCGWKW